ncbi:MAG: ABC transporter ATP-binding protein [Actinomycetota bacterium]
MTGDDILLGVHGVTTRFPGVIANADVSVAIPRGSVHCLLGENGAGKSTLAETMYGVHRPDDGHLRFKGERIDFRSPRDAIACGIGMVHQHFELVTPLSTIENVALGTTGKGWLDLESVRAKLTDLCGTYDVELDLDAPVGVLPVGLQQWVEILKTMYLGVDLLILDEPTAALTPAGVELLFASIRRMRDDGLSVILISHKMHEVTGVSDRVTVLRKGKVVDTVDTSAVDAAELTRMMVGRSVELSSVEDHPDPTDSVLRVEGLVVGDAGERGSLNGVDLTVEGRTIYGIAGVSGNGQSALFDALVGVRPATAGSVHIGGEDIAGLGPRRISALGVGSVPADRINQALLMDFGVDENLALGRHRDRPFSIRGLLRRKAFNARAREAIDDYEIATPGPGHITRVLSGGNLQKIVMARELEGEPNLIVVHQPTRGLDVSAADNVRRRLIAERDRGAAVVLISDDLDEVLSLASRVGVMFEGRIIGEVDDPVAERDRIGLLMAGVTDAHEAAADQVGEDDTDAAGGDPALDDEHEVVNT